MKPNFSAENLESSHLDGGMMIDLYKRMFTNCFLTSITMNMIIYSHMQQVYGQPLRALLQLSQNKCLLSISN